MKFIVVNYDSDGQFTYLDLVEADDKTKATAIAFESRDQNCDCLCHVATYSVEDVEALLVRMKSEPAARSKRKFNEGFGLRHAPEFKENPFS